MAGVYFAKEGKFMPFAVISFEENCSQGMQRILGREHPTFTEIVYQALQLCILLPEFGNPVHASERMSQKHSNKEMEEWTSATEDWRSFCGWCTVQYILQRRKF